MPGPTTAGIIDGRIAGGTTGHQNSENIREHAEGLVGLWNDHIEMIAPTSGPSQTRGRKALRKRKQRHRTIRTSQNSEVCSETLDRTDNAPL